MGRYDILKKLVITDASGEMLVHSLGWTGYGAVVECARAGDLPYPDDWFDLVVAGAGDPYNESQTWRETARVLRKGGFCIFTTPSYQWSVEFRKLTNGDLDSAEFELRSGQKIAVPSLIYPRRRQECEMRKAGLYTLRYGVVEVGDITGQEVSPKLLLNDNSSPVMEAYLVTKRRSSAF